MNVRIWLFLSALAIWVTTAGASETDTLPPLNGGKAPQTIMEAWGDFDPRAEPLNVEVLKEWEEQDVVMQVLRYHVGIFKGKAAKIIAVYGYPKGAKALPGLVQIHGGGQYAHHNAVLTNAKRGYASISISWAGRISAPGYNVNPNIVKLFWDNKTDNPQYKVTTDWGALDAYHAPSRDKKTIFPSVKPTDWTLDSVESPRNAPWFLCALGARRALTFLEQQPQVDPNRLGVYGHSMGGKLTVMTTAADKRVKAAAPSCGGVSDRKNDSALFRATIGDDAQLPHIDCPIIFLSPANDFHGLINDVPKAIKEIKSTEWRVTSAPHHNHQDTAEYEVATQLWFDQHLKQSFKWPANSYVRMDIKTQTKVPWLVVRPDDSHKILDVDIYYTQQGIETDGKADRHNTVHQFWHRGDVVRTDKSYSSHLHVESLDKPLWAYANITYALDKPVSGAGYYYGDYTADRFVVSTLLQVAQPKQLKKAGIIKTMRPSRLIEAFEEGWEKEWFNYRANRWAKTTNKIYNPKWHAPKGGRLALDVQSDMPNTLVVRIDNHAAEVPLKGGKQWQSIFLSPRDFKDAAKKQLSSWEGSKQLQLSDHETLRDGKETRKVGKPWQGNAPSFRQLRWLPGAK